MIVWSWSDMGIFFLLCLFLGQLTAMARLSRVPALTQILNVVFALFRRVPALAFMGLLLAWQRGLGNDLSSAMVFVVLLLCFVPEMSDVQMESMRKAPESRNPDGDDYRGSQVNRLCHCPANRDFPRRGRGVDWKGTGFDLRRGTGTSN